MKLSHYLAAGRLLNFARAAFVIAALTALWCVPASAQEQKPASQLLNSFETEADAKAFAPSGGTTTERVQEHATDGQWALKVTIPGSSKDTWPGVIYAPPVHDLSNYAALSFDLYNPAKPLDFAVCVSDANGKKHFLMLWQKPTGFLTVDIWIKDLRRDLDVTNVAKITVYRSKPREDCALYLDNFRLGSGHEAAHGASSAPAASKAVPMIYDGFEKPEAGWERYLPPGNETNGAVNWVPEGFADPGAIQVQYTAGALGLAAARTLARADLESSKRWTVSVVAKSQGGAKSSLTVQQLDASGALLSEDAGDPVTGENWQPIHVTVELKNQTTAVRILLVNGGTGSATFDDVLVRPATGQSQPLSRNELPIRVGLYPADAIAAIDHSAPKITTPSGQASAIGIFLAGERRPGATTTLDIEFPSWMKMLTAQWTVRGTESLKWEMLPSADKDRVTYRFTNPYPWMLRADGTFYPWYNMIVVFQTDAQPGTEGKVLIRTALDKDAGQERTLQVLVRKAIPPLSRLEDFDVGLWDFSWPNVVQDEAREKLLGVYAAAGLNMASFRTNQLCAVPTFKKLGLSPCFCICDPSSSAAYGAAPELLKPENMMQLADGKISKRCVALGLALNDPNLHAAYRKYVASQLAGYPDFGKYVFTDVEYWGEGDTRTACFHPSTIAAFRQYAKIGDAVPLTPEIILKQYGAPWVDFRLWLYAEMHRLTRQSLREVNPHIDVIAYDYPLDKGGVEPNWIRGEAMGTLHLDPVVDGHLLSTYNREGLKFIEALENTIPSLKKPVWAIPYLMKNLNDLQDHHYAQISAREYRFETVAAAAYGARGISGYPGALLDADYLLALREGLQAVADYKEFYFQGKRDDGTVKLMVAPALIKATVHRLGGRQLLTVFNTGDEPAELRYRCNDREAVCRVEAQGFMQIEITATTPH